MSMEFQYDVFLSHSQADKPQVRPLAERLRAAGLRVWFDEWLIDPGDNIPLAIEQGLEKSRRLALFMSPAALGSHWVGLERSSALFRDPSNTDRRFIPVLLADCGIPDMLRCFKYVDLRGETEAAIAELIRACRPPVMTPPPGPPPPLEPTPTIPDPIAGGIPIECVRTSRSRLPGEVFAVELLQRPIEIIRQDNGRFRITIDRRGVRHAVITTEAKNQIIRQYVAGKEDQLRKLDEAVHAFLLGASREKRFVIDLPELQLPLRWASGGVMSVVSRTNAPHEKWTPFFFRDINPWGWNIALGSCERDFDEHWMCRRSGEEELKDPRRFLFREFLEETLVLSSRPQVGNPVWFKRFYFDDYLADEQLKMSAEFARTHIRHRTQDDGIEIHAEADQRGKLSPGTIRVYPGVVKMDARVIDPQGDESNHFGFLVVFNLLELGIEVVRVFEYEIGADDYFLDGELLAHSDGSSELVRMPVALLSHRALRRFLGPDSYRPAYTDDRPPSFIGGRMKPREMQVFDWDIQQRLERMRSSRTPERERRRYEQWFRRFGPHLLTNEGTFQCSEGPQVFTPAAAKILSLYFAQMP